MNEEDIRLANDSQPFTPVHPQIRAIGPRDLQLAKGRGPLKLELDLDDNRKELHDPKELQRDLAFWIEGYYNRERRHSTIGYLSPIDYEQQFTVAHTFTETGL